MVTINQELISKEDQELMDKMNDLEGKIIMSCNELWDQPEWVRETVLMESIKQIIVKHRGLSAQGK